MLQDSCSGWSMLSLSLGLFPLPHCCSASPCYPELLPQAASCGSAVICNHQLWHRDSTDQGATQTASIGWDHSLVVRCSGTHTCVAWEPLITAQDKEEAVQGSGQAAAQCPHDCLRMPVSIVSVSAGGLQSPSQFLSPSHKSHPISIAVSDWQFVHFVRASRP